MTFNREEIQSIRTALKDGKKDLPEEILELIYVKKLFRLFLPAELDGLQLDLPPALQLLEQCAAIDGDFGWQVNIGSGGGFFAGYMDPDVVRERFARRDFLISGSGVPAGSIRKENNEYLVNGSWKYCSGSSYATLFTFSCMTADGEMRAVALDPDQVRIIEDWDAYGLSATTSHSIEVEGARVPESMIFDVTRKTQEYGYKLFDYPFTEFARAAFLATVSGCYRHFLEETGAYCSALSGSQQEKRLSLERLLEEHWKTFTRKNEEYLDTMNRSWSELGETGTIQKEILDKINQQIFDLARFIHTSAAEILFYTGMAAVRTSSPINKIWRDLSTACQHIFLKDYSAPVARHVQINNPR